MKYEVIDPNKDRRLFIIAFALCGGVAGLLLAVAAAYLFRRHSRFREKFANITQADNEPSQDYQVSEDMNSDFNWLIIDFILQ